MQGGAGPGAQQRLHTPTVCPSFPERIPALLSPQLQEEVEAHLRGRQTLEQKLAAQQRRLELAQQQQQGAG